VSPRAGPSPDARRGRADHRPRASRSARWLSLATIAVATILLSGCEEKQPGRALAQGLGRDALVAPGGAAVAFFLDASHPDDRAVPADLFLGDLWLADVRGQAPAFKVAAGVATTPGNTVFRPDGAAIATLGSFRFHTGEGELWAASSAGAPRKLADSAQSFAWAPRGEALAWIAQGRLLVAADPLGSAATLPPVDLAQSFSWSPDAQLLAVRTIGRGRIVLLDAKGGAQRELAAESSDFLFASDGALGVLSRPGPKGGDRDLLLFTPKSELFAGGAVEPRVIGRATSFGFSPDGQQLLLLSTDSARGEAFGDLSRVSRSGGPAQALGEKVSEFRFAPKGDLLFLANYDTRARAGSLMLAPASGAAPREVARHVQSFQVAPAGDRVLYLVQSASKTDFKVELWTAELSEHDGFSRAPRKIDDGVYGYLLSPDGSTLFWKSRCVGGRSCELLRAPIGVVAEPVVMSLLVAGFELAPASNRLLVAHPHKSAARAVDLTLQDAFAPPPEHPPEPFATEVDPSARFLDPAGKLVIAPFLKGHAASVRLIELP